MSSNSTGLPTFLEQNKDKLDSLLITANSTKGIKEGNMISFSNLAKSNMDKKAYTMLVASNYEMEMGFQKRKGDGIHKILKGRSEKTWVMVGTIPVEYLGPSAKIDSFMAHVETNSEESPLTTLIKKAKLKEGRH